MQPVEQVPLSTGTLARGPHLAPCNGSIVANSLNSQGEYVKYLSDGQDGFNCCAWIVKQPWSNGRIGTQGLSSNFPHFDLNLNTGAPEGAGGGMRVATNRVFMDEEHASRASVKFEARPIVPAVAKGWSAASRV